MNNDVVKLIVELRLLIGFLGEKSQYDWWESNFMGPTSDAFDTFEEIFPYLRCKIDASASYTNVTTY
ncbi:BrxE family protein [Porticoccus sp. GXU_MW_L64]